MLNVSEDGKKAVAVEVNAETDFVAKNEKFRGYVAQVAEQAMDTTAADVEGFLAELGNSIPTRPLAKSWLIRSLPSART